MGLHSQYTKLNDILYVHMHSKSSMLTSSNKIQSPFLSAFRNGPSLHLNVIFFLPSTGRSDPNRSQISYVCIKQLHIATGLINHLNELELFNKTI